MRLTVEIIEDRLEEAALTLRRMPNPPGSGPKGYGSSWPEYVHEVKHAYGYGEARMRVVPNPAEIQRMDEAIEWLRFLSPDDAKIVWLRAEGRRWRQVCIAVGLVRQTAWRRWVASLQTISNHLNQSRRGARAKTAKPVKVPARSADGPMRAGQLPLEDGDDAP